MPACEQRCWLSTHGPHGREVAGGVVLDGVLWGQGAGLLRGVGGVGRDVISASALRRRDVDAVLRGRACRLGRGRMQQSVKCLCSPPSQDCCTPGACCWLFVHSVCMMVVALMRVRVGIVQLAAREGEKKATSSLQHRLQWQGL